MRGSEAEPVSELTAKSSMTALCPRRGDQYDGEFFTTLVSFTLPDTYAQFAHCATRSAASAQSAVATVRAARMCARAATRPAPVPLKVIT